VLSQTVSVTVRLYEHQGHRGGQHEGDRGQHQPGVRYAAGVHGGRQAVRGAQAGGLAERVAVAAHHERQPYQREQAERSGKQDAVPRGDRIAVADEQGEHGHGGQQVARIGDTALAEVDQHDRAGGEHVRREQGDDRDGLRRGRPPGPSTVPPAQEQSAQNGTDGQQCADGQHGTDGVRRGPKGTGEELGAPEHPGVLVEPEGDGRRRVQHRDPLVGEASQRLPAARQVPVQPTVALEEPADPEQHGDGDGRRGGCGRAHTAPAGRRRVHQHGDRRCQHRERSRLAPCGSCRRGKQRRAGEQSQPPAGRSAQEHGRSGGQGAGARRDRKGVVVDLPRHRHQQRHRCQQGGGGDGVSGARALHHLGTWQPPAGRRTAIWRGGSTSPCYWQGGTCDLLKAASRTCGVGVGYSVGCPLGFVTAGPAFWRGDSKVGLRAGRCPAVGSTSRRQDTTRQVPVVIAGVLPVGLSEPWGLRAALGQGTLGATSLWPALQSPAPTRTRGLILELAPGDGSVARRAVFLVGARYCRVHRRGPTEPVLAARNVVFASTTHAQQSEAPSQAGGAVDALPAAPAALVARHR